MGLITDTSKNYIILFLAVLSISLGCTIWWLNNTIDKYGNTIATLTVETKLGELQQDALRKAIIDQSEAVEKQRIDTENRAKNFEIKSKHIWTDFEKMKETVKDLSVDEQCQAMREIVRGAVE